MYSDLATLCVPRESTVREAVAHMDVSRLGIVLIVDEDGKLVGTVTDGDIRRAILANVDLGAPVTTLLAHKAGTRYATPITAPAGADRATYVRILQEHKIYQLPLLDAEGRVVGMVTLDEFVPKSVLPLQAVIMAGGAGTRLRPLTDEIPKPMLPVGNRPLLEVIIGQLREAGITQVKVTTHHKPGKISEHFGDGQQFGVDITYVAEDSPLGTAGGLGLMDPPKDTVLVINGDILTQLDFRAMLAYHREHRADLTVVVSRYALQVPYGVVQCEGASVIRLTEKPLLNFFVNAGIYLLEPIVHRYIPAGQRLDMTEVIQRILEEKRLVVAFPVREYWLDIGQIQDYERAQRDVGMGKVEP